MLPAPRISAVLESRTWKIRTRPIRSKAVVFEEVIAALQALNIDESTSEADQTPGDLRVGSEELRVEATVLSIDDNVAFAIVVTDIGNVPIVDVARLIRKEERSVVESSKSIYDDAFPPLICILSSQYTAKDVVELEAIDVFPYSFDPTSENVDDVLNLLADEFLATAHPEELPARKVLKDADPAAWSGRGPGITDEAAAEFRQRIRQTTETI